MSRPRTGSCSRSSPCCRYSSLPTTSPGSGDSTWISPATSPRPSRSSSPPRIGDGGVGYDAALMRSGKRTLACAAAAAALALPACGGDGGGVSSDDPASLAPANAPLYVQATIRPQGEQKSNVEAL